MRVPPVNPVLARELKERMRRRRSTVVLSLYLLVLSAALWLLYLGFSVGGDLDGPGVLRIASLGRTAFQTVLFAMLMLVCFIVPGLCAGAIAGERERQTLVPLQVTLLRPASILFGKLASSLAFVVFLILAALPLVGVSFLLGGVDAGEVVRGVAMVLVTATVIGCLSLTCSTVLRRTQGATVASYGLVLVLLGGTFVAFGAQMLADQRGPEGRLQAVLWANPVMATADVLSRDQGGDLVPSPFTPFQSLIALREGERQGQFVEAQPFGPGEFVEGGDIVVDTTLSTGVGDDGFGGDGLGGPGPDGPGGRGGDRAPFLNRAPFWMLSVLTWGLLCGAGFAWSCRRLRLPAPADRA